jgi:4-diphosphocytidyl-2-C-methyl-D-erythritol kinase
VSGRSAKTLAQAKVNLALRVFGKEPDGYHSIETVFHRLELGDDVEVRTTRGNRSLKCYEMRDWPQETNIAYLAAAVYADQTGWPKGFEIEIEKRIPVGGGLGGGSADAAAVLRILNTLSPNPVSGDRLLDLAGRIGADVPFLASESVMALSWGRGEKMLQLEPLPPRDVHLFFPPYGIDTGEAYDLLDSVRGAYEGSGPQLTAEMFRDWDSAAENSVNDFEPVIRPRWLEIDTLLSRGERFGLFYRMSGSGSTVFKVTGVRKPATDPDAEIPPLEVPDGTTKIVTRTAASVVPVEILD